LIWAALKQKAFTQKVGEEDRQSLRNEGEDCLNQDLKIPLIT